MIVQVLGQVGIRIMIFILTIDLNIMPVFFQDCGDIAKPHGKHMGKGIVVINY
jgi:hypothetical protein